MPSHLHSAGFEACREVDLRRYTARLDSKNYGLCLEDRSTASLDTACNCSIHLSDFEGCTIRTPLMCCTSMYRSRFQMRRPNLPSNLARLLAATCSRCCKRSSRFGY